LRPSVDGGGIEPAGLPGSAGVGKGRARHRKIVSNPGISRAQIQKVLDKDSLCCPGADLFRLRQGQHGADAASRSAANRGAEAAQITQVGNPFVFRTAFGQQFSMPKIANYLHDGLKAKTVAVIWVNNDFGKGGHDSFVKEMEPRGIKVIADLSTEQGQVDFASDVARLKSDQNGDIDRASFLAEIVDGKQNIVAILPKLGKWDIPATPAANAIIWGDLVTRGFHSRK